MRKIAIIISLIMIMSTFTFIGFNTKADALHTEFEFIPNIITSTNLSRVTIGLYVTPQTGQEIDTVQTNLVTFNPDMLQFVGTGVSWGNLFSSGIIKIDGTVDNAAGTVKNIVWGSSTPTTTPGYFYYMTFDVIGSGTTYVEIDYDSVGVARNGMPLPKKLVNNCTFYIAEIPLPPSVTASVNGSKQIDFNWDMGEGADLTYIEYSTEPGLWNMSEGIELYNSDGTSFHHTNLTPLTTYYYQLWSWNNTYSRYGDYISLERTTLNNIPMASNPDPDYNYMSVYTKNMSIYVYDEDDDLIDVSFYWSNGTLVESFTNVTSYSTISLHIPDYIPGDWLEHNTNYDWYVILTDGREINTSDIFTFRTSMAWDVNEDRTINYLDVSLVVTNYLKSVTPAGSEGWDITENGIVNYLDVSMLVSNYLETY